MTIQAEVFTLKPDVWEKIPPSLGRQKSTIFQSNTLSWAPTHGHQKWSRCTPDLVTWFVSVSLRRKLEHHYIKPPVDSKTRTNVNWSYQELSKWSKWSKWPEKENHQWDRPRQQAQKRDTYPGDRNLEVLQLCPNLEQAHANVVPDLPIGPVTEAWRDDYCICSSLCRCAMQCFLTSRSLCSICENSHFVVLSGASTSCTTCFLQCRNVRGKRSCAWPCDLPYGEIVMGTLNLY